MVRFRHFLILWFLVVTCQLAPRSCAAQPQTNGSLDEDLKSLLKFSENFLAPQTGFLTWREDLPVCNWAGVQCSHTAPIRVTAVTVISQVAGGHVSSYALSILSSVQALEVLILVNLGFTGAVPDFLSSLKQLRHLNLSHNALSDALPAFLGFTRTLQTLDLSNNLFSGEIPPDFGQLTVLQTLSLSHNSLGGILPPALNELPLKTLNLSHNSFSGGIPPRLMHNLIPSIQTLDLSYCNLSGMLPPVIGYCRFLQVLHLTQNSFSGALPSTMTQLDSLFSLHLNANTFSGPFPSWLLSLHSIVTIDVSANAFTGPLPNTTCPATQVGLQHLLASDNRLQGPIPASLGSCLYLTQIELSNNSPGISGPIPSSLVNCTSLTYLDLSHNPNLSGQIPLSLSLLPNLTTLNLNSCNLSGAIPPLWANHSPSEFADNEALCGPPLSTPCPLPPPSSSNTLSTWAVVGISSGVAVVVCGALLLLVRCMAGQSKGRLGRSLRWGVDEGVDLLERGDLGRRRSRSGSKRGSLGSSEGEMLVFESVECEVSLEDLLSGTKYFDSSSRLQSQSGGGMGETYRGELRDGTEIAIKRLPKGCLIAEGDLRSELVTLGGIRHRHLLPLLAAYTEPQSGELLLIHRWSPRGSLDAMLAQGLTWQWPARQRLAVGAAAGLKHIHTEGAPRIIHRAFKAGNLVVGRDQEALVGDFGMDRLVDVESCDVATWRHGTPGYAAPEFVHEGRVSTKTDVYSFGVVLLQLVTGKAVADLLFLGRGVHKWAKTASLEEVVDERMEWRGAYLSQIIGALQLGIMCTAPKPGERPSMERVVQVLGELNGFSTARI